MAHYSNILFPHELTSIQHEVLIGGLLGDIGMALDGKYPRFKIDRQALDKPYLDWQFNIFKDLCKSGVKEFSRYDKRYNKSYDYVSFRTRAIPAFLYYYKSWYPNNIRQVPEDIVISKRILAVWFADDGCIINQKYDLLTMKFSTESFGKYGTEILSNKLSLMYNKKFPIYNKKKGKDQYFIKISTLPAHDIIKDIEPYIIEMNMTRKSDIWKNLNLTDNFRHKYTFKKNNSIE